MVQPGGSDSASLDNVFEVLVRAGRPAPMAKALLIPEAWARDEGLMKADHRALYAYCNAVMEPWDGPAAICATDGRYIVCGKDRNGLRPLRAMVTHDGLLLAGSEAGLAGLPEARIARRLPIGPGRMIVADLKTGTILDESEAIDALLDFLSGLTAAMAETREEVAAVVACSVQSAAAFGFGDVSLCNCACVAHRRRSPRQLRQNCVPLRSESPT